jgi:hypothetical protein
MKKRFISSLSMTIGVEQIFVGKHLYKKADVKKCA